MSVALPIVQAGLIGEALEAGPVGVLVTDDDGRHLAANGFACELLGYTREELLELRIDDLCVDPATADFATQRRWDGEPHLRHKDGSVHRYRIVASETRIAALQFTVAVLSPLET